MLIPTMQPVVFAGFGLDGDATHAYFQDLDSFNQGVDIESARIGKGDAKFFVFPKLQMGDIFDYENALDELLKCALLRSKKGIK